jgi:hypothetical protein
MSGGLRGNHTVHGALNGSATGTALWEANGLDKLGFHRQEEIGVRIRWHRILRGHGQGGWGQSGDFAA